MQSIAIEKDFLSTLSQDIFYFVIPFGLSNTNFLCGYKEAIEKHYGGKIHFVIKPSHEVVMKMYNIKDYIVKEFKKDELFAIKTENPAPLKGSLFIAHPEYLNQAELVNTFDNNEFNLLDLYNRLFDLDKNAEFKFPTWYPEISEKLNEKLKKVARLDKIALIAPETKLINDLDLQLFNPVIKQLRKEGYTVIINVKDRTNWLNGTIYMDLSLEEVIALSLNCGKFCSARSGLCDLIAKIAQNAIVYYPNDSTHKIYNLKSMFNNNSIKEIVFDKSIKEKTVYMFDKPVLTIKKFDKNNETKYYLFDSILIMSTKEDIV